MMMYKISMVLAVIFWGPALSAVADVLVTGDSELAGIFCGYDRKRLAFQQWEKDAPGHYDIARVRRLRLDQPVRVSFTYVRNSRQKQAGLLHGYWDGDFELESGGRRFTAPDWKIACLEVKFDMRDFMLRREAALRPASSRAGAGAVFQAAKALVAGQAHVVHFHQPGSAASERQGSYARRLCEDSRGQARYHQVRVEPRPDDPNVRQHGLQSLPQFWFYDSAGVLVERLAERFTEADLEKALASARRRR